MKIITEVTGRTGIQVYTEDELIDGGLNYKYVNALRPSEVVEASMPHMKGIPVTTDHDNFIYKQVGYVIDSWLEDELIYTTMAIDDNIIPVGFSIGYDASVVQAEDGYIFDLIIPTHIALVDVPRCGKACIV